MVRFCVAAAALLATCVSTCHAFTSINAVNGGPTRLAFSQSCHFQQETKKNPLDVLSRQQQHHHYSISSLTRLHSTKEEQPSSMGDILLFNSLHNTKEPFSPLQKQQVSMYTCGPKIADMS